MTSPNPKATRRWKRKLNARNILRAALILALVLAVGGLAIWLLQRWSR
jgi:hypothetical protein